MGTNHRTQISFDDQEYEFFMEYAKRKGLTLSALTKMSLAQYATRYAIKGLELYPDEPVDQKDSKSP